MKDKKLILLSPSNTEEKADLLLIVKELELNYLLLPEHKYKIKILSKIINLIAMIIFCKKYKPSIIFGAPNLNNRITSFFLRIKYITYMRGLHVNSKSLTSVSDYIYKYLNFISKKSFLINNYQANYCIVSSSVTKQFLIERNIEENKIFVCGPVWLSKVLKVRPTENRINKSKLIYITQAYKEHRLIDADLAQQKYILELDKFTLKYNYEFYLKVHPRDYTDYSKYNIINSKPIDFLQELNLEDIILTPFSTLAFESIYIGANVKFIKFSEFDILYKDVYEKFNIKIENIKNFSFLKTEYNFPIFNDINLSEIKKIL